MTELKTEEAIIEAFQNLRTELESIHNKINDLTAEAQEHELVCKTLAPLDGNRKCFRLVGDVLVERTVAEVIPAVTSNKQQLEMVVSRISEQAESKKAELSAFQEKYKIRIKGQEEPQQAKEKEGSGSQGVLVSKT